jgi:hypothetical protein
MMAALDVSYPPPETVKGRTLGALLRRERLTAGDIWRRFGSSRASEHAHALRKAGWPLQTTLIEVATSDAGRTAMIGVYWLPDAAIEAAGLVGAEYAARTAVVERERKAA